MVTAGRDGNDAGAEAEDGDWRRLNRDVVRRVAVPDLATCVAAPAERRILDCYSARMVLPSVNQGDVVRQAYDVYGSGLVVSPRSVTELAGCVRTPARDSTIL
jgi:hypothetical protein